MKNYFLKSFLMLFFVLSTTNIQASGFLMFPILGYTKSTAPVTAIFDHDRNTNSIKTFKGEVGSYKDGCLAYINGSNTTCSSSTKIRAYKRPSGLAWTVTGINYIDAAPGTNIYMWYDNHNGYDYAVPDMTPVVAAASGTGEITDKDLKWGQIKINHGNGYRTIYTHMRLNMPLPKIIKKGSIIGWVSDVAPATDPVFPHLHFVVETNLNGAWESTDPYGGNGKPVLWE